MTNTREERIAHLREEEQRILGQLEEANQPVDYGSDTDAFDEETDEATDAANRAGREQMLREQLAEIRRSLEELEEQN